MANQYGMNMPSSYLQNNFLFGESGDKLTVNKDSDYYKLTANTIINFSTTELGNLRVLKKPIINASDSTFSDVQQVISTEFDFIIVIVKTKILTLKKTDYSLINEVSGINFDRKICRASLVENFLMVPQIDGSRKDYEVNSNGQFGENTDFKASLRKPIKNKFKIKVDIYQVRNLDLGSGTASKRPYLLSTTELQEFDVSDDGKLQFKYDKNLKITRIYFPYQSNMTNIKNIPDLNVNDYFVSIFPIETLEGGEFYIGNSKIEFSGEKNDTSGKYYETINKTGTIGKTGLITYGNMFKNFENEFNIIAYYQNRMVVSNGEYIYFSKVGDYNYFLNGEKVDDAFYIKLSTINSEKSKILNIIPGRGLWVITDKGVFIVGYNQIITGSSIEVRFIGSDRCTLECVDVNNTLYYLTVDNELKAVQNTTGVKGYIDFGVNTVDKFNSTKNIDTLGEHILENKKVLFCGLKTLESNTFNVNVGAFIYKEENINIFSRISAEYPLKAITNYEVMYIDSNNILTPGTNNMKDAYIALNVPPTYTKMNGYLLNDASSIYKGVTLKFATDSIDDISGVTCNGIPSNQLGDPSQGVYSLYTFKSIAGSNLLERIKLIVESSENTADIELQATEVFYTLGQY